MLETQRSGTAIADCLGAVFPGPDSIDRRAGLLRMGEFINKVCSALTPSK